MPPGQLLGLDIGTSRIKAMLIDGDGEPIRTTVTRTPFRAVPDGTEMTAPELLEAVQGAVRELGELDGVSGVGLTTMGEVGTLVRPDGSTPVPLIAWYDARGQQLARELEDRFGAELVERSGRPARAASTVAQLGWLERRGVDLSGTWVGVAGLVLRSMTGAVAQEASLAATSGAFDPRQGRYLTEVLAAAGVEEVQFAPVRTAGAVHGLTTATIAAWSGLPAGIPVTIAGHDHLVGAIGASAVPGEVVDSVGSGEPLLAAIPAGTTAQVVRRALTELDGDVTVTSWPGSALTAVMCEALRPGLGLAKLAQGLSRDRDELEAAAADVGAVDPWSLADLRRVERAPDDPSVLAAVVDDVRAGAPAATAWAAALEGYAEAAARADRLLRRCTGSSSPAVVIGGGTRSVRWMAAKRRRSACGIRLVREPETAARGAAVFAGVAAGLWADAELAPRWKSVHGVVDSASPIF